MLNVAGELTHDWCLLESFLTDGTLQIVGSFFFSYFLTIFTVVFWLVIAWTNDSTERVSCLLSMFFGFLLLTLVKREETIVILVITQWLLLTILWSKHSVLLIHIGFRGRWLNIKNSLLIVLVIINFAWCRADLTKHVVFIRALEWSEITRNNSFPNFLEGVLSYILEGSLT